LVGIDENQQKPISVLALSLREVNWIYQSRMQCAYAF